MLSSLKMSGPPVLRRVYVWLSAQECCTLLTQIDVVWTFSAIRCLLRFERLLLECDGVEEALLGEDLVDDDPHGGGGVEAEGAGRRQQQLALHRKLVLLRPATAVVRHRVHVARQCLPTRQHVGSRFNLPIGNFTISVITIVLLPIKIWIRKNQAFRQDLW